MSETIHHYYGNPPSGYPVPANGSYGMQPPPLGHVYGMQPPPLGLAVPNGGVNGYNSPQQQRVHTDARVTAYYNQRRNLQNQVPFGNYYGPHRSAPRFQQERRVEPYGGPQRRGYRGDSNQRRLPQSASAPALRARGVGQSDTPETPNNVERALGTERHGYQALPLARQGGFHSMPNLQQLPTLFETKNDSVDEIDDGIDLDLYEIEYEDTDHARQGANHERDTAHYLSKKTIEKALMNEGVIKALIRARGKRLTFIFAVPPSTPGLPKSCIVIPAESEEIDHEGGITKIKIKRVTGFEMRIEDSRLFEIRINNMRQSKWMEGGRRLKPGYDVRFVYEDGRVRADAPSEWALSKLQRLEKAEGAYDFMDEVDARIKTDEKEAAKAAEKKESERKEIEARKAAIMAQFG